MPSMVMETIWRELQADGATVLVPYPDGVNLHGRPLLGLVTDTGVPAGFSGWPWTTGLMRSSQPMSRFASGPVIPANRKFLGKSGG